MDIVIDKVLRSGVVKGGHAIIIDLQTPNGETVTIECAHEKLSFLAMAINDAGVIAERARKSEPSETISTEVPYLATGVGTGTSTDDRYVLVKFPTTVGTPVIVAMSPDVGRRTIELLSIELENLSKQQSRKPS